MYSLFICTHCLYSFSEIGSVPFHVVLKDEQKEQTGLFASKSTTVSINSVFYNFTIRVYIDR